MRQGKASDDLGGESSAKASSPILPSTSTTALKDGSDFHVVGEFRNPQEIIKRSPDFESVIIVLQQIKIDEKLHPEVHIIDDAAQHDADVQTLADGCNLLREIGPPWSWLHNFASQTNRERSYNFLESAASDAATARVATANEQHSSDECFDYLNEKFVSAKATDDAKSSASGASAVSFSLYKADSADDVVSNNHHQVLIDTICCISEASEKGECSIRETSSIASLLDAQHSKRQLQDVDHERLKSFVDRAEQRGLVFNDLNELYNYFIHESARERSHGVEIREEDDDEAELENLIGCTDDAQPDDADKSNKDETSKNVVSIFGESGIEVDGKLLDAKVSERMILGLVDKPLFEDNVSDVASSVSSLSQAETVKLKQNVTREKDTQTAAYSEQLRLKRMQGKSKSASSINRQPFTCKIPQIPGIGPSMDGERLEQVLRFITHRSFQQGGLVYPRNFFEDECPTMMLP